MIGTVIIKAIRACNLRCPYCYYINDQTVGYGRRIQSETLARLYAHVADYIGADGVFSFVWHGGEPLLIGRRQFQEFLDLQSEYFAEGQVDNSLQTNGVLVDQDWIDFFERNNVGVGISFDSNPETHDKNRVTIHGEGTYDQVVDAIRLFQRNKASVGTLTVVDGAANGYEAMRHIEELGVQLCDFLVPITNNALQEQESGGSYHDYTDFTKIGEFLVGAFRRWSEEDKPELSVRLFECVVRNAFGIDSGYLDAGSTNVVDFLVLEPEGDLCLDPDFWHIDRYGLGEFYSAGHSVHDDGFSLEALNAELTQFAESQRLTVLPDDCQNCKVRSLCRGSHPASRYGSDGTFNHRSAYCEAMFALCDEILDYLVSRGYSERLYDEDLRQHLQRQIAQAV